MQSFFQNPLENLSEEYRRLNDGDNLNLGFDWTSDYTSKFDDEGHELVLAFQLNGSLTKDKKHLERIGNDPAQDYKEKNQNTGDNFEPTIQLDYTNPLSETFELETGVKTVLRNIDSEYDFQIFDTQLGQYETDWERTNEFLYGQNVFAGYASMNIILQKPGQQWREHGMRQLKSMVNLRMEAVLLIRVMGIFFPL